MRLMTYNLEWFDHLFEADNSLKTDDDSKKRFDAIAEVLTNTNPDLIGITEGPNTTTTTGSRSTVQALENFASTFGLRQIKALLGYPSAGKQEIALLYDPDVVEAEHDPGGKSGHKKNPPFNEQFQADSDGDGIPEIYKHYRPPLEAKVTRKDTGDSFWIIVVHAKSKGIFTATDRIHFDRISDRNRKKLFAECGSVRLRVDEWFKKDRPIAVMGDINDGPGFDFYESRFGKSAVELILGDIYEAETVLRYPLGRPEFGRYGWEPSTTSFKDKFTGDYINAIIDHIMVSHHFEPANDAPVIVWNPFQTDEAKPLKEALLAASDHFPVTLDVD